MFNHRQIAIWFLGAVLVAGLSIAVGKGVPKRTASKENSAQTPDKGALTQKQKGYLDYLDSYYLSGNPNDLDLARSEVKDELDFSNDLRFQGYYYNAEIQYLLALEQLRQDPRNAELQEKQRMLLLQLYSRYLDAYYKIDPEQLRASNVPGNTAFLLKDILMAAAISPSANSCAPMVKNVLRRANRDSLYDSENSYVASVNDMLALEYPNLFWVANLVKGVWLNDQFIGMKQASPAKDSLRKTVNYYASIASDTLKSAYGKTIASFLLAETYANSDNDMAWSYFKKCIDILKSEKVDPSGFYARNYNAEIYVATAVAFLPTYAEFLFGAGRYPEVVTCSQYLLDSGLLDRGKSENVSKEAIFWGEKSIRSLQNDSRFASADELFQRMQSFYKIVESKSRFGGTE